MPARAASGAASIAHKSIAHNESGLALLMSDRSLTELIRVQGGDAEAAEASFAATYDDSCRLVRARLGIGDRGHFMRWAGRVMRSVREAPP